MEEPKKTTQRSTLKPFKELHVDGTKAKVGPIARAATVGRK
jgi:hypothetical protein